MEVNIRAAAAEDASFLAQVMLIASRSHRPFGLWEQYVGGTEQDTLSFLEKVAVTKLPHLFHHEVFLIAENQGRPVAGLSGYNSDTHGMRFYGNALPDVFKECGWTREDAKQASRRIASYMACIAEEPSGIWIVESVGALPEVRRQGVMSLLLNRIIEKGRCLGFNKAQITVMISNTPARRAYEKAGFRYVDEKRDPGFEATYGDYGIARLSMEI